MDAGLGDLTALAIESRTLLPAPALYVAMDNLTTTNPQVERAGAGTPDRLILVYDGNSGLGPMLLDVLKKAVGKEECALCEITYGPLGKRGAWRACEARLGMVVDELHRDQLPVEWRISREELPCVLARTRTEPPHILVSRDEILSCSGSVEALESKLQANLSAAGGGR